MKKKGHSGATYAGLMKADADKTPLDLQIATSNVVNIKERRAGREGVGEGRVGGEDRRAGVRERERGRVARERERKRQLSKCRPREARVIEVAPSSGSRSSACPTQIHTPTPSHTHTSAQAHLHTLSSTHTHTRAMRVFGPRARTSCRLG